MTIGDNDRKPVLELAKHTAFVSLVIGRSGHDWSLLLQFAKLPLKERKRIAIVRRQRSGLDQSRRGNGRRQLGRLLRTSAKLREQRVEVEKLFDRNWLRLRRSGWRHLKA